MPWDKIVQREVNTLAPLPPPPLSIRFRRFCLDLSFAFYTYRLRLACAVRGHRMIQIGTVQAAPLSFSRPFYRCARCARVFTGGGR